MTKTSINTLYSKRGAEKFKGSQNHPKLNGFSRSLKHLLEDIEITLER